MNSSRLAAIAGRVPADVAEVGQDLVVRPAVGVAEDGGVATDRGQSRRGAVRGPAIRSAASRAAARSAAIGEPGALEQLHEQVGVRRRPGRRTARPRSARPSLIRHSGRVDQQDRRLEPARHRRRDRPPSRRARGGGRGTSRARPWSTSPARPNRQVRVDVDARTATAVEPVVGRPWLAGDERDAEVLAVGQAERASPRAPGTARRASDTTGGRRSMRDLELGVPGLEPIGQRPVARAAAPSSARRGRLELGVRAARRRVGEAARDVLEIRQRVAGERRAPASRGPRAARRATPDDRAAATSAGRADRATRAASSREARRRAELLHVHLRP